ncbi:hypothetical protein CR203_10975 [Salipaludibacillus neizhouensis]|uniref:Copper resistance protein CopC n=1 Tax=Salipaludibacillus neizhouensis TaxID=885475 RepID=A0A3A9KHA1_9BACI|nr:copper resistance protein CopC [Salipaludibacillus neizhouensis]RKL67035.1 hypothetical protein CR203_10975 [Salipaludibacillus neizhouensis]
MGKIKFILYILVIFFFTSPMIGEAHAYLTQSSPSQETQLEESPTEIKVQFSEPIDTAISQIKLKNGDGDVMEGELLSGEEDNSLVLLIPELENDRYHVSWQVLALDSHITEGSFRFSVGEELPKQLPEDTVTIGAEAEEQVVPSSERDGFLSILRVLENLVFVVIASWYVFIYHFWKRKESLEDYPSLRTERRLYFSGFLLFTMSGMSHVFWRARQFMEGEDLQLMWQSAESIVISSVIGWMAILRPLLFLLLFGLTFLSLSKWLSALLLLVFLGSFTVTSHATGFGEVVSHYMHMSMVVIWIGGLLGFTVMSFTLPSEPDLMMLFHKRLRKFSKVALTSVILLSASGLWLSYRLVGSMENLFASVYGETLLWKIGFFVIAIIVAAFHRFVWLPNLKKLRGMQDKQQQLKALVWGLRLELILVIVSLVFAGMLSTTSPPTEIDHDHGTETENHDH